MDNEWNEVSLDSLCAALCCVMGVEPPEHAAAKNETLCAYAEKALGGRRADRLFMYNPDAVAQWIYEKYPEFTAEMQAVSELSLPMRTVMPSVTPVCFGTMYTGAQPEVHGIRRYEKPVIKLDSIFDAMLRAGKRVAVLAERDCSMAKIFLEREMDYFIYDSIPEINAKAAELIAGDRHDMIVVYNGNYDAVMHKHGPEDVHALAELRQNSFAFATFINLIKNYWKSHDTLAGFAMDHGCHEIDGHCGSHGLDMPEDLNILHRYVAIPRA